MKKIFALVLSLCLVLSTFVAVSAQEQVYLEGNEVTLVNIEKNFDAADGEVLYGAGISGSQVADPAGGAGMVAGGAISTGSTGYIGVKLPVLALNAGDIVEISVDVYSSADWQAGAGSTQGVMLRAGDNWAPAGSWEQVLKKEDVAANTWTTLTNEFTVTKAVAGKGIWMQVRPNVVLDYFYIDNLSLKITGGQDKVASVNATMDDASTGILKTNSTVTYADGKATVTMTGTGNNDMIGIKLVDTNGTPVTELKAGDVINWSVEINPSVSFTPAVGGTKGMFLRCGGANYPPSASQFKQIAPAVAIPANQTTVWSGSYAMPETYSSTGIYMNIRPEFAGTMVLDNFKVEVVRGATIVKAGWGTPSYDIPFSAANAQTFGTASNGTFTYTAADVHSKMTSAAANPYTGFVKVVPATPLSKTADWTLSYDITFTDIVDTDGKDDVWLRLLDNTASASQGVTVGYVQKNIPFTGTQTVTFNSANMVAGGGTSSSSTIAAINITVDMANVWTEYDKAPNSGSFTISNIRLVSNETKVALSAEAIDDYVTLTLSNSNAQDYKFAGRLLVAEYVTVDGVKEMVQFAEVAVDEIVEAGEGVDVVAQLEEAITGDVQVFVWEPASLDPITMIEL